MKRILAFALLICLLFTSSAFGAVSKPGQVQAVWAQGEATGTIDVQWRKVDGATGYKIYVSEDEDFGFKLKKTLKKQSTVSTYLYDFEPNKTYYLKMRAYKTTGGKTYYGAYSDTVMFVTKSSNPTYYDDFALLQPATGAALFFSNEEYAFPVSIKTNNIFAYDLKTGEVVAQLKATCYNTNEDFTKVLNVEEESYTVRPGETFCFGLEQTGFNKITLDSAKHGLIYNLTYNTDKYDYPYVVKLYKNIVNGQEQKQSYYANLSWQYRY